MKNVNKLPETTPILADSRRSFLRVASVAAVTGGLLTACSTADMQVQPSGARAAAPGDVVTLPGGDIGILNYAYVLEQLEARFYEMVVANFYEGITQMERQLLTDLRNHEVIHREFFKAALGGAAVPQLTFDFSGINFRQRTDVLTAAKVFEDTGVGAYNGAGKYLQSADFLTLAGKIVSVEARHSSIIREMQYMNQTAFAGEDIVDPNGLHLAFEPSAVLPKVQPFIRETIDARNLLTRAA